MNADIKQVLYQKCLAYIEERIQNVHTALDAALEAGNDETKSTAGDKHETGRAMAQLEQEQARKQLSEALELKNALLKMNPDQNTAKAALGSLVITDKANFYIAIAAGKIMIDKETYFAISPLSPIGSKLMGLSVNQEIIFNQQKYKLKILV